MNSLPSFPETKSESEIANKSVRKYIMPIRALSQVLEFISWDSVPARKRSLQQQEILREPLIAAASVIAMPPTLLAPVFLQCFWTTKSGSPLPADKKSSFPVPFFSSKKKWHSTTGTTQKEPRTPDLLEILATDRQTDLDLHCLSSFCPRLQQILHRTEKERKKTEIKSGS